MGFEGVSEGAIGKQEGRALCLARQRGSTPTAQGGMTSTQAICEVTGSVLWFCLWRGFPE